MCSLPTTLVSFSPYSLNHFAISIAAKLGLNAQNLEKVLWGDYYVNMKTKHIMKGAQSKAKKPLFVQLVLENLWKVYEATLLNKDPQVCSFICHISL